MPKIGIQNVSPRYDGEYELDMDIAFSIREWRWIKQVAGYAPMTIQTGLDDADPALFTALAVIAMYRAGKISREQVLEAAETLEDAPFDGSSITILAGDEEAVDDDPPEPTSEPDKPSVTGSLEKQNGSGPDSTSGSEVSDVTREATGTLR